MGDGLFRRVGHTDEATASLGGDARFWSPFHPDYSPNTGRRQQAAEAREMAGRVEGGVRTNPPLKTPAVAAALDYAAKRLEAGANGEIESVFSSHTILALGGFIVNRSWGEALGLCNRMIAYGRSAGKIHVSRQVKDRKTGKMRSVSKPMLMTDTPSGIYAKLVALRSYLVCLDEGREPVRKSKKGKPISLFDDVRDCCIVETGNVKLPFVAYSEIPVVTCPGAGGVSRFGQLQGNALGTAKIEGTGPTREGCATFCYSLKVFGKPSVVFRLLINTLGFSANPARHVQTVCEEVLKTKKRILRLFVDGDFRSTEAVWYWMNAIKVLGQHGVHVYGYSKSWEEFLAVNREYNRDGKFWPRNYALNLSGGSRHDAAMRGQMKRLLDWKDAGGVVRGEFNAVQVLERLCWKAAGLEQGERLWKAFLRETDSVKTSSPQYKKAKHRLVEALRAVNPGVVASYDNYTQAAAQIDASVSDYNVYVAGKVKGGPKAAQPLQLAPGQAAQALTWKLLQAIKQTDEFSCPISCGSCPRSMIREHDATIRQLFGRQHADVLANMKTAQQVTAEMAARTDGSGTVHACGDQRIRKSIIIGLH
jgi:hypothetical protein